MVLQRATEWFGQAGAVARRLSGRLDGAMHLPGETGYDALRRPPFAPLDPWPVVVVEAARPGDVQAVVAAARDDGLPLAVQSTGHGTTVASDGGILLRTSRMASVLVDPDRQLARVGPGARWEDVLAAAAPFGLAPLCGSAPSVGVTGFTLGGGVGWLSRRYGFAADSVLRAQVVTADGRRLTASPNEHPHLFWALRGGGGNFGVVTSLEFRLYPVAQVYAGTAHFAIDRAAETLARYRDWATKVPDELSTAILLTRLADSPDVSEPLRGKPVLTIKAMYAGAPAEAERLLRPLRDAAGPALFDDVRPRSFARTAMGGTRPQQLNLVDALPDPLLDLLVDAAEQGPTVEVRHWGGAMAQAGADAGPVGHRAAPFSVIVDADLPDAAEAMRPYSTGGSFLNFLQDPARVETAYTPADFRRLRTVKSTYDPDNVFCLNHNIPPLGATTRAAG